MNDKESNGIGIYIVKIDEGGGGVSGVCGQLMYFIKLGQNNKVEILIFGVKIR